MIKADLITGFLGAGKTTFLARYVRYLASRGQKIGVIAVVDARQPDALSGESAYLMMAQTAEAGAVLFSKVQNYPENEADRTIQLLNTVMEQYGASRRFSPNRVREPLIFIKNWDDLTEEDFGDIASSGYLPCEHIKIPVDRSNHYKTLFYMNRAISPSELAEKARGLLADERAGHVLRVKGFVREGEAWYELNATKEEITVREAPVGQEIIIVIGENLNRTAIDVLFQ